MSDLLPFIVTGLATGSLYSLAGLGLVLTYRTSGVFNFGHGAIAAGGAFVFYTLYHQQGIPWPIAMVLTVGIFALIGGLVLELVCRTLADAPAAISVIVTVGLFLFVNGLLVTVYGLETLQTEQFLPESGFVFAGVAVSWAQVISAAIALAGAVALYRFLQSSRSGVTMRSVVDNPTLVALTGQPPARVRRRAWMIGAGFAAMSGILLAPTLGLDATLLTLLVVQAFGGCAIGMFKSLPLTYVGGLLVGVAAALSTRYLTTFPLNQFAPAVPFVVLIGVLLIVPLRRLPGTRSLPRPLDTAPPRQPSVVRRGAVLAGLVFLILVPVFAGARLAVWTDAMSSTLVFGSLALLVWTSGQMSLCQISFAAIGATSMAHLTQAGVPWLLALVLAALFTVPVGAIVAIPAVRFSGIYLALVTFGFGILMQFVVYPSALMFGTELAVSSSRLQLGSIDAQHSNKAHYYVALSVAAIGVATLVVLSRSRFGRLLRGLSESPTMLSTMGLNVNTTRVMLFSISAMFAGAGGALMSCQYTVSASSFNPVQSLLLVAMLGVCGLVGTRLISTTVLAALLLSVLPGYVDNFDANLQLLIFGALAMLAGIVIANRERFNARLRQLTAESADRLTRSPVQARPKRATQGAAILESPIVLAGEHS